MHFPVSPGIYSGTGRKTERHCQVLRKHMGECEAGTQKMSLTDLGEQGG